MRRLGGVSLAMVLVAFLAACSGAGEPTIGPVASATTAEDAVAERVEQLQRAVTRWRDSATIAEAHAAAEEAANLVVGRQGPGFGDRDGDGQTTGGVAVGLLSGADGTPDGLAVALRDVPCVARDILGATADDAAAGWAQMQDAIEAWTPSNNTMPTLASHPMRVVGWATFTIATDDLDLAHEYAGHAQLHVDVSRQALAC